MRLDPRDMIGAFKRRAIFVTGNRDCVLRRRVIPISTPLMILPIRYPLFVYAVRKGRKLQSDYSIGRCFSAFGELIERLSVFIDCLAVELYRNSTDSVEPLPSITGEEGEFQLIDKIQMVRPRLLARSRLLQSPRETTQIR